MSGKASPAVIIAIALAASVGATSLIGGETTVNTVDGLRNALNSASPGDRIYVAPGNYNSRLWVQDVHGTSEAMIEVVALDPDNRPVFDVQDAACLTLYDCSYILVDGIIAQGGGTASSDANNIEFPYGSHMIIKNCLSRDLTCEFNSNAYKFAHADNLLMYNCVAEEWVNSGYGMCINVSDSSLYMRNTITFPTLPLYAGASGIMAKGAAYHYGMYKNHFIDGGSRAICFGGAGGATGPEIYDSVAMGNVIEGGEAAVAYVSSENCDFAYNTVVDPELFVMRVLKESTFSPANNIFRRNLVYYGNVTVQNIGSSTQPETFTYAENYWYKYTNPGGSIPTLAAPETDPAGGTDPQLDSEQRPHYGQAKDYGAHAPAMEQEFAQHQDWFQWAWDKAIAYEPDAGADGPYQVYVGGSVALDGSGSYAGTGSYGDYFIDSYLWDLDYDGDFDDGSGNTVLLSYDDLTGTLALAPGTHTIELRISVTTEGGVMVDWGTTELEIFSHPETPGDGNGDGAVDGADYTIWADHYQDSPVAPWAEGGWQIGNFNADDIVDGADYTFWADNYERPKGAPVPEPATLALLGLGAVLPLLRKRRTPCP